MKLTDKTIAALALPPGKSEAIFFDDAVTGFAVRLRRDCTPIFILQYRRGSRQRRMSLGRVGKVGVDAARKHARKLAARVELGEDPQAEKIEKKAAPAHSFKAVVELYLAAREKAVKLGKLRSNTEVARYLRKHWSPLHRLDVDAVDRQRVAVLLNKIVAESGSTAAARARSALQSMFMWAMGEGIALANPVMGTNTPETSAPRERALAHDEIRDVWNACRDDDHGRIVRLLLLTGCRRAEIGGLRWPEVDLKNAVINLPAERVKNGRPFQVHLSPPAVEILRSVPQRADRDFLFGIGQRGYNGWHLGRRRLDARLPPMPEWHTHDLRRTTATGMADLGIQPHVIEAALNHQSGAKRGVAGVYNRSPYTAEVKQALARWAEKVREIVEGGERKVLTFPGAA